MADLPRILLVDDSRVVRITLAQQLKQSYDIREECDGEAAWQALVLDHSVRAVISDLQMPKLDGIELVKRMRASKLKRLKELPFILVSGEETDSERQTAVQAGVSDFITKGLNSAQILARVDHLLQTGQPLPPDAVISPAAKAPQQPMQQQPQQQPFAQQAAMQTQQYAQQSLQFAQTPQAAAQQSSFAGANPQMMNTPSAAVRKPTNSAFEVHKNQLESLVGQALAHAHSYHEDLSVMILAFDNYDELISRLGNTAAEEICKRFIRILADKMRKGDTLAQYAAGQYVVLSANTPLKACAAFAERVRKAVNVASLSVRGQNIALTISIGLSSIAEDNPTSSSSLLELTASRMMLAAQAGGNQVVTTGGTVEQLSLVAALQLLNAGKIAPVLPHLQQLTLEIMPLLDVLQKNLNLPFPMAQLHQFTSR